MKAARFILVAGLLIAIVLALLVFTKVRPEQGMHNGTAQVSTKTDVSVAHTSKQNNGGVSAALNSRPGRPLSESVAHASPASKIDTSPSQNLPVAQDKPRLNLPVGQKAEALFASEDKPDLPVSQRHQSITPVSATDETKSDSMGLSPEAIDIIAMSYLNNPEVHGQNGQLLPSPEKVLASKAKSILENYKDRNTEGVIISEDEEIDGSETTSNGNSSNNGVGSDSADMTGSTAVVTDTETTVESLAEQHASANPTDTKSETDRLLAALAEGNPVDVRLEAIYLLADVAPDQTKKFLNDKEDVIRCEAERIAGIIPHD